MKTDNSQSIRRNRWFRLASSLMATLFLITCIVSCSEEDISGDITGKYGNLTGADDTVITIGTRGDGYNRVGQGHYCPLPPSEPYVRVSPHTAQAFQSLCSCAETGSSYFLFPLFFTG